MSGPKASRRAVLAISAGAAGALAGCEVYGDEPAAPPAPPPPQPGASGESGGGTVVATTDQVEVGGGLLLGDYGIVVTQPTAGDFRAFSSICTHQGCTVTSISDGTINCDCHGSRFSIEDGSVVQPAGGVEPGQQDPLPQAGITVAGNEIQFP